MGLRDKYADAIQTAKGFHMEGSARRARREAPLPRDGGNAGRGQQDLGRHQDHSDMAERNRRGHQGDAEKQAAAAAGPVLHGEVGRHAQQDRQGNAGRFGQVHDDLQREQRSADRSGQDQARPGPEDPAA